MPYIIPERRNEIEEPGSIIHGSSIDTDGELNFAISRLAAFYLQKHGLSYTTIGQIRSAMLNASDEFYRRVAAPYEDKKRKENGDVY